MLAFASAGSSIFTDVVAVNWDHALNSRTPPSLLLYSGGDTQSQASESWRSRTRTRTKASELVNNKPEIRACCGLTDTTAAGTTLASRAGEAGGVTLAAATYSHIYFHICFSCVGVGLTVTSRGVDAQGQVGSFRRLCVCASVCASVALLIILGRR